jgi:hypothetical protein
VISLRCIPALSLVVDRDAKYFPAMRQRVPTLLLLGSSFAFLASLYLPWQTSPAASCGTNCVASVFTGDGWSSGVGDAATLVALAAAVVAAVALVRPAWSGRLPLARCGLALGYFSLAVLVGVWSREGLLQTTTAPFTRHLHWTYGTYFGVACGAVALCAAAAIRPELVRRPSASSLVVALPGLGLLASFLLPWYRFSNAGSPLYWVAGISGPAAALAALAVCFAGVGAARRVGAASAAALLTIGAFTENGFGLAIRAYGAWMALGFALALVAATAIAARGSLRRPALAGGPWDAFAAGAGVVLVVSLFQPWQRFCLPAGSAGFGHGLGRCFSQNGWSLSGSAAGLLAAAVVALTVLWPRRPRAELLVAIALLVATAGFTTSGPPIGVSFAYGAYVAFAAAGVLLVAGVRARPLPRLDRSRLPVHAVPVTASFLFLSAVLLPWWSVLPPAWEDSAGVLAEWLAVGGLLLSLHLLASWLPWADRPGRVAGTLTIAPLALLGLVVVAIVRERSQGLTWGDGIMVGLCLFLLLLGSSEDKQRLERLRIPELLRVDRLPGTES